ncbi:MAG: hypothetical protein K9I70_03880 [Chitinophagaceae bacterium]|nr:hypothetical protein [Chitinophagaceae bacterium]
MEINWNTIKNEIKLETRNILPREPQLKIDETLDLFFQVLQFQVETKDGKINGLTERVPNAFHRIFIDKLPRVDINTYFGDAVKIEPYLRKILFLVNKPMYLNIHNDKDGLSAVISALDLKKSPFKDEYWVSYDLRNDESHQCENWSNSEIWEKLRSIFVMYLYATYKHQTALKVAINPFDASQYLNSEVQRIKFLQSRFVHIEGKETFTEVDLYARELIESDEEDTEEEQEVREGTIDNLRKTIKERKMILLGDVGMGKSTTLLFLHLQDAQAALLDNKKNIPVYLELKNLTDKDSILGKIKSKLKLDSAIFDDLLNKGRLNIFLDGLNEIEKNIKVSVFNQINNLLEEYPKNFFLFTGRPQHYSREFDNNLSKRKIPVFTLQKMGDKQIDDFITKNGKTVKDYLLGEINANERLKRIIQTPLMLTMLIAVVLKEGKIPNEKGKIIRAFMHSLYLREQKQIIDFDIELFHLLLCYLGFQTRDLTGSNSGLDRDEYIIPLLEQRKVQLGVPINLLDFLRKAIDLNILVNDNNQYSFSHELYQEYYAAEFLMQLTKAGNG